MIRRAALFPDRIGVETLELELSFQWFVHQYIAAPDHLQVPANLGALVEGDRPDRCFTDLISFLITR